MGSDSGTSALVRTQCRDGGWGYSSGSSSWTEPTALAVLALSETREAHEAVVRGCEWLVRMQRSDGGWPPCAAVDRSTWVTSFAGIALVQRGLVHHGASVRRASSWLLTNSGLGPSKVERLRTWLMREKGDETPSGWSWYPGTASWVIPTAASLLALRKMGIDASERIDHGKGFLLARECSGGGWNHGGTFVQSENAAPYPETTGLVLLALRDSEPRRLAVSLARARRMLKAPQSAQGSAWLRMGLVAHGMDALPNARGRNWTTVDIAVDAMASLYRNPLLS